MNDKFIAYYRVSTQRQGRSGLGLEAQRQAVAHYLDGSRWELLAEFTEVESGKRDNRAELQKALAACKRNKAKLVIAKLDRLSRNASFLLSLRDAKVDFVCADMPEANRLTIGIMAVMAEHERDMISKRTKEALAAAKRRGVKLGNDRADVKAMNAEKKRQADDFAESLRPMLEALQSAGMTQRRIVEELNARGIASRTGGVWHLTQLRRVINRLAA